MAAAFAGAVKSAKAMITYTPRRVVLEPHSSQVVRLRVLRPPDLAAGEYRTHLTVTAVPSEDTGVTADIDLTKNVKARAEAGAAGNASAGVAVQWDY